MTASRIAFNFVNYGFLTLMSLLALFPFLNVLALSLSNKTAAAAGLVKLWPVDFTLSSYQFVFLRHEFFTALGITLERVLLGTALSMLISVLAAYPLSKEERAFPGRTLYAWIFVFTILFNGGLIPWYMTIKMTGILDSVWALVLPGAVQVFNCLLLLNFFRGLPKALEEAAFVDGANHWTTLGRIFVPLSTPVLATVTLFTVVGHWNSWFDGIVLMNSPSHYPLQSYLQTVVVKMNTSTFARASKAAWRNLGPNGEGRANLHGDLARVMRLSVPAKVFYVRDRAGQRERITG